MATASGGIGHRVIWGLRVAAIVFAVEVLLVFGPLVLLGPLGHPGSTDFAHFYVTSRVGLEHGWPHLYDHALLVQAFHDVGLPGGPQAVGTPLLFWMIAPLAELPLQLATDLWFAMMLAVLLGAWWLAAPGRLADRAAHLAALLSFLPTMYALGYGQPSLAVGLVVAASWTLLARGREVAAGVVLSLIVLKPNLAFIVPFCFLAAGYVRAFAAWAVATGVMAASVLAVLGAEGAGQYLSTLVAAQRSSDLIGYYMSPAGILPGAAGLAAQMLCAAGALAAAWRSRSAELATVAGVVGSLLVSPYLHGYDLVVLVIAAWIYLRTGLPPWQAAFLLGGWIACQVAAVDVPALGWISAAFEFAWLVLLLKQRYSPPKRPACCRWLMAGELLRRRT